MTDETLRRRWRRIRTKAYPPAKVASERQNNPASYLVYRRLSWPITALALLLGVTALQTTILALILTLIGLAALVLGNFIWGAAYLNVAYVLDQVDGNIARATGSTSRRGAWLDSMVGMFYSSFTLGAAGVGLFFHGPSQLRSVEWIAGESVAVPDVALMFGIIGTLAIVTRKLSVSMADAVKVRGGVSHYVAGGGVLRLPKAVNSFALLLLAVAVFFHWLPEYVVLYSTYHVLLMGATCAMIFCKLDSRPNSSSVE